MVGNGDRASLKKSSKFLVNFFVMVKCNREEHETVSFSELPQNKQLCNYNPGQENRTMPELQSRSFLMPLARHWPVPLSLQKVNTLLAFTVITDFWF